jgi:hypothetical protein
MSEERPHAWLERGAQIVGVSFPERTIELVVIPYETETEVLYQSPPLAPDPRRQGRVMKESVAGGGV